MSAAEVEQQVDRALALADGFRELADEFERRGMLDAALLTLAKAREVNSNALSVLNGAPS